jgi:hypothetical protein
MNYRTILSFILFSIILYSCEKDTERQVDYRITDSASGFSVRYLDETGQLMEDNIEAQSSQDIWTYSFVSVDGGIVFVSANYKDPESSIKVQVYIDGKVYKQAASKKDTVSFITVSGVIPIRE